MEKEPRFEKSLEEKLREKGFYQIEKVQLPEDEPRQCDQCINESDNFQFHQEGWIIEGDFYCSGHKERALEMLEAIDQDAEKQKLEQESKKEERLKSQPPWRKEKI